MKYEEKSFTVPLGGKSFADGWDRVFKKPVKKKQKKVKK